jgi:threonine dehydrogenase-like Zn-dependent dehydrogenase
MEFYMKAAVVEKNGVLKIWDIPEPNINDYQALVKIKACAICNGTDSKIYDGSLPFARVYPTVLGHESVGEVVKIGSRVKRYKTGDMVFRPGIFYENNTPLASSWGGFAEYGIVSDMFAQAEDGLAAPSNATMQQIIPPEAGVNAVDATMLITYKETISFLQNFGVGPGKSVVVWGTGPVGLCFVLFAKLLGAYPVICCGRRDSALKEAEKMGADMTVNITKQDAVKTVMEYTEGRGADKIVDGVGDFSIAQSSIQMTASWGEIGIYGIAPVDGDNKSASTVNMGGRYSPFAIRILGPDESAAHDQMMALVKLGMVDAHALVDEVIGLSDIQKGFEMIWNKQARKVVVEL